MVEVVYKLLDMGVNIDSGNKHGHNPLVWACICGHNEVIKALLFRGANINHITEEGRNCLHYTCQYAKPKAASVIIDFLIEKFQTFRLDHPKLKPDASRWSKYAKILEDFMEVNNEMSSEEDNGKQHLRSFRTLNLKNETKSEVQNALAETKTN